MREITDKEIEAAGDECHKQFISHPPKRADYLGGFIVGAYWMRGELEAELAAVEARERRLREACEKLLRTWDDFCADDASVNPLDYPIDEPIHEMQEIFGHVAPGPEGGAA